MVKAPAYGRGFSPALCAAIETRGIRIYPPIPVVRVFTAGKSLPANLVPIAPQPRRRLMLLRKCPALSLLPVPAL